ncbi:MAG: radical SAM protein [Caldisericia bacterium]|nr:radical SAM protein [Caldisericia bacterium]
MRIIKEFDPWKGKFCTCPKKYSLNPYTGCSFNCIYCYITSYIKNSNKVRLKQNLIDNVKRDLKNFDKNFYIMLSNSSDPYPYIEKHLKITREILKIFMENNIKVLIVTKSDILLRDIDILKEMNVVVTVTITINDENYKKIEPYAPSPERRINMLKILKENGIQTAVRIDPIIPFFNDDLRKIEDLIRLVSKYSNQIISSTLKLKFDSMKRFKEKLSDIYEKMIPLYKEKYGNSLYIESSYRERLLKNIRDIALSYGLYFSTCRENLSFLNTNVCDGSGLFKK